MINKTQEAEYKHVLPSNHRMVVPKTFFFHTLMQAV